MLLPRVHRLTNGTPAPLNSGFIGKLATALALDGWHRCTRTGVPARIDGGVIVTSGHAAFRRAVRREAIYWLKDAARHTMPRRAREDAADAAFGVATGRASEYVRLLAYAALWRLPMLDADPLPYRHDNNEGDNE